jgi:hypothetical protein
MMHDPTDTEARLHAAEAEVARLRDENKWLRDREAFIARALGVCGGGRYRNDWPGAIERLKANVRDACSVACHEMRADYEAHGWSDRATGASECVAAIAAIDMGAL